MKDLAFQVMTSDRSMITAGVAGISSPFWLPSIETLSNIAAVWLPILGCLWMFIQMGFFVYGKIKVYKKGRRR